jgi:hypothetical protein
MSQIQHGLTPAEYLRFRERYLPEQPKIIFVLESPPKSGRYFYNPEGLISEPLFSAMMKDVLEVKPSSKDEGLRRFATSGCLLLDATYTPVNHPHLSSREWDDLLVADFSLLVEELRKCDRPDTKVVLVKANVCRLLDSRLTGRGFTVLNHGKTIPFPSTGQQRKFREAIRQVLGIGSAEYSKSLSTLPIPSRAS